MALSRVVSVFRSMHDLSDLGEELDVKKGLNWKTACEIARSVPVSPRDIYAVLELGCTRDDVLCAIDLNLRHGQSPLSGLHEITTQRRI